MARKKKVAFVIGQRPQSCEPELVHHGGHYDRRAECAKLVTAERPPGTVPQSGRTYLHSIAYGRAVFMTFLDLE